MTPTVSPTRRPGRIGGRPVRSLGLARGDAADCRQGRPAPRCDQLCITDPDGHRITACVINTTKGQLANLEPRTTTGPAPRTASATPRKPVWPTCPLTTSPRSRPRPPSSRSPRTTRLDADPGATRHEARPGSPSDCSCACWPSPAGSRSPPAAGYCTWLPRRPGSISSLPACAVSMPPPFPADHRRPCLEDPLNLRARGTRRPSRRHGRVCHIPMPQSQAMAVKSPPVDPPNQDRKSPSWCSVYERWRGGVSGGGVIMPRFDVGDDLIDCGEPSCRLFGRTSDQHGYPALSTSRHAATIALWFSSFARREAAASYCQSAVSACWMALA
jgi:hypothetical protein